MTDNTKHFVCTFLLIVLLGLFAANCGKMLVYLIPYEERKQSGIETTAEIMGYDKLVDTSDDVHYTYKLRFYDKYNVVHYVQCDFSTEEEFDSCEKVTIYYNEENPLSLCIKGANNGKEYIAPTVSMLLLSVGMFFFRLSVKRNSRNREY